MANKTNPDKIIVHAAGGCGISVADKVMTRIAALGDGYAEIVFKYIDTTKNNIDHIEPKGEFWQITQKNADGSAVDGSGGERSAQAGNIDKSIKEYLDHNKIYKQVTGEYHMVISSMSGGSGSVIGATLTRELLKRDIPVLPVLIGDTSNALGAINTVDGFKTLDSISRMLNKPVVTYYVNNHKLGPSISANRAQANEILFRDLSVVSIFLSGMNDSLDYSDMVSMIYPAYYKKVEVKPGVYGLQVFDKEPPKQQGPDKPEEYTVPLVGRSLTVKGGEINLNFGLNHFKEGIIVSENVLNTYTTDKSPYLPLYMFLMLDPYSYIVNEINTKIISRYNEIAKETKTTNICEMTGSVADEETGIVF